MFCFCLFSVGLSVSIPGLERALHHYTLAPSDKPFDMKSVPLANAVYVEQKTGRKLQSDLQFTITIVVQVLM